VGADRYVEHGIAVFSNWGVFGAVAVGFLLEGIAREAYPLSLIGVAAVIGGFIGHLLVNAWFDLSFSRAEGGLGLATLGLAVIVFVVSWLASPLAETTIWTGLTLIVALIAVAAVYLATRYGLKGAFSQFHGRSARGGSR
jgi:hypothetical protein